jgi:cellulose synthase/poly-beta-1,6-N-acetylglucosamine synthase-like glycosyltransferase
MPAWLTFENVLLAVYLLVLGALALFGVHRALLVRLYRRHRHETPQPRSRFATLPMVTIQLPLYNERYVAERLLDAVARIDWPRDRLEVQVLDDSTDETSALCRARCESLRSTGLDIHHLRRADRTGFKAGALAAGLRSARGEYVLLFDADFLPAPDVLHQTIHYFTDPVVAMVQVRWEHVNRDWSPLTQVQALMLDGHFVIEHTARHRAGRFFNFSGTAGVWRRAAIDDAGGWSHDTLTEDLDLSYRVQLRGWRFVYLKDVVAAAELPVDMNAFKAQQFRWAKGQTQVAKKLLSSVLRARLPFAVKLEALFHLTNNLAYPLLLLHAILILPNLLLRIHHGWQEVLLLDLPLFFGTTLSLAAFYVTAQREIGRGVGPTLKRLPLLMALCIGLSVNQARAVIEALFGRVSGEFVRTPKLGVSDHRAALPTRRYRARSTLIAAVEVVLACYFAAALVLAPLAGHYLSLPFLALFFAGFSYVAALSLKPAR